jgi:hypothetical protein
MPAIAKPVPVSVPELIVTAAVPVEVSVTVWLVDVFTFTSPKLMLLVLGLSIAVCAFSCSEKTVETLLAVAVSVAVCVDVTAVAVALKAAVVAPAATVTEPGTVTAPSLLASVTTCPPAGAAALSVTVHASVPAPVIDPFAQAKELSTPGADCPVPLRLIVTVPLVVAFEVITIDPVTAPAVVGSNCTCRVAACPGFSVTGNVAPGSVKPAPVTVAELIVRADNPEEVSVTACVVAEFRVTFPNARLPVLTLSAGVCGSSCKA